MSSSPSKPSAPPELAGLLEAPSLAPYKDAVARSLRAAWRLEPVRFRRLRPGLLEQLRARLFRKAEAFGPPPPSSPYRAVAAPRDVGLPPEASKLGGAPYLESPEQWPRAPSGERLPFVAQVNFAELPELASPAPRKGIFVLFATRAEPRYVCRWYPEPAGATAMDGPCLGAFEHRLAATPALTISYESFYESSFEADDGEGLYEDLDAFLAREGGNLGAFTIGTLPSPAPRIWTGAEPKAGERWVQLWCQDLEETFGSLLFSVVVRLEDFERGALERTAVVGWQ